jgi:diguanylate cyclase (GGDEF)-like protein
MRAESHLNFLQAGIVMQCLTGQEPALSAELRNLESRKDSGKTKDLLHSLVPRAQCFCFYDTDRQCLWSTDGADDYEIDNFVIDLPDDYVAGKDTDTLRRTLNSGRTLVVLPVYAEESVGLGILVAVFSRNAGKSSSFNANALAEILAPAVAVIGEGLHISRQLQMAKEHNVAANSELALVYAVDEKLHGSPRSHAGLAQLVGQSGRFLGIAYSVLLIPSKRIRISATHSSWKNVNRKVLERYLIDHLVPKLGGRRAPSIFEIPGIDGPTNVADQVYQALLCPLFDKHGNVEGVLAQLGQLDCRSFTDSDRRFTAHIVRKVEYVIEQSFDAMTGQMNRVGFEAQLHESYKTLTSENESHQLIYCDLDNLQLVNDNFGHKAGDEVITRFARLLEVDLPNSAVVSRLTGDDFCILLTQADREAAMQVAKDIRKNGKALRYLEGDRSLQVTISIGIAELSRRTENEGRALTAARMACDAAKDHGRDRIEVYDDQDLSIIRRYDDMQLVTEIQRSLDGDEFELLAQPIRDLQGGNDRPHFEVLLRMRDSDGIHVASNAFFSAAERYQMMPQIDRWVVSATIARLSDHLKQVIDQGAVFAINLSGQSLSHDGLLEFIEQELDERGVPATSVCFEITESAAVSNLERAKAFIDALRKRGCKISLDDFGAGLSSFAYLKSFNVDTLKIDGGFIRDINTNRISESMVAAITQVAKVMDFDTVAEYVETNQALKLITELGVDYGQGYLFSKPIPIDEALQSLADKSYSSNFQLAIVDA